MRINLISKKQFNLICKIQKKHEYLTFENKGYEYRRKASNEKEEVAEKQISDILKDHIWGFSSFSNFRIRKDRIQLRVQYNYGAEDDTRPFTGVGYLFLDELLNGFK